MLLKNEMDPGGFEPPTFRLRAERSNQTELRVRFLGKPNQFKYFFFHFIYSVKR